MTAHVTERALGARAFAPSRTEDYIRAHSFDRPTLVIDTDAVARQYGALKTGLGRARIHYAVKANPAAEVIETLTALGSGFDAASRAEIELCLSQGADPDHISFGNTVKKPADIAFAHHAGVTLFAADAEEELEKIAENAPGARVYIRMIVEASEADWPLTRKFGCASGEARGLMDYAVELGLTPVGLSFHVGSQTRRAEMWSPILAQVASVWHSVAAGHDLTLLNLGGGFPAFYGDAIEAPAAYAARVMDLVSLYFGDVAEIMAEPGRGLVAEAGAIAAEVLLVSKKSHDEYLHRWVYLDIGKFSGLAETMDEAIRYQFLTERDHERFGPCILAGPSCDSADVLYEKRMIDLPLGLKGGDKVIIRNCGAYTSSYASVGFNGFPPLDVVVI